MLRSNQFFRNLVGLIIVSVLFSNAQAQDDKPDFYYEITSEVDDDPSFLQVSVSPVEFSYMGNFVGFGIGASVLASDVFDNFSFEGKLDYNYFNFSTDKNKLNIVTPNYEKPKSYSLDFTIGYTIKKETKSEEWGLSLDTKGNTEYVSYVPAKAVYRYCARVGFNRRLNIAKTEVYYYDSITDDFGQVFNSQLGGGLHLAQFQNSLTLGFERKISVESTYRTDKYGVKVNSIEKSLFVDALIGLGGEFPILYETQFDDPFRPNDITSIEQLSANGQNGIEEDEIMKKLPVGLRLGISQGSRKVHQFGWNIEFGIYPGFYRRDIQNLIQLRLGVNYRFMNVFNRP